VARTSRSTVVSVNAERVHGRLAAAADAGLALAVESLSADPATRWTLDGQTHVEDFDDATLTIAVEDERGKAPLNVLTDSQVRALFQRAGADPSAVEGLVTAFLDWRDPNRRHEAGDPTTVRAPPNPAGGFRTVQELSLLPGITPELYAAIAPSVTVSSGDTAFEPRTATPLALAVMDEGDADSPAMIERMRELAGQRTALDTEPAINPIGRALTIRVAADDGQGGHVEQATILQLTNQPQLPYLVRLRPQ
jgi:general secretion pathway protein K